MAQAIANQTVRRLSLGVGLLACLALSGCGGGGGGGNAPAPAPAAPPPPASNPSLTVESTSIDFGNVLLNRQVQRRLQVTNNGNVNLDVTASINDVTFGVTGDCTGLAPGVSCELVVSFSPDLQQDFSADLELDSNANTPTIVLSGKGVALNLQITELATNCAVDPEEVNGRLIVSDSFDMPVLGLDASKFTLFLNGDPVNSGIDTFTLTALSTLTPVSVGLLIDISQSLAGNRNNIAQQAGIFLEDHFSPDDTAGVFRFASKVDSGDLARGFIATDAAGIAELQDTFDNPFDGTLDATVIWDSADAVLDLVIQEVNPNRAIVVLSDGQDTISSVTLDELIARAAAENIAFFTIGFGDIDTLPLERLANETGGLFFAAPDSTQLLATFQAIASNVTDQYEVSFIHPAPQSSAELTVRVFDDPNRGEDSRDVPVCP